MEPIQNTPSASGLTNPQKPGMAPLKGKVVRGPGQAGDEAAQLRKAAMDFEAVFMTEVLKGMRETVHKEDMFHGGAGEDMFEGLLDEEVAKRIAGQGGLGIGDMLYRDLSRRFHIGEAQGAKVPLDPTIKKFLPIPGAAGAKDKPFSPAEPRKTFQPLRPGAKADAAAPQGASPAEGTAEVEAQVRRLRQQAMGMDGAMMKK